MNDRELARVPQRLERCETRMQPEEAIEIDGALSRSWRGNADARPCGVVLALAERNDHIQPVDSAALKDRDEDLAACAAGGFHRARQECRRETEAEERQPPVLHEDASRKHAYLLWNSGEPSVSAITCRGSVAFAIVAAVASESCPPSAGSTGAVPNWTPRILPPTSCSAKFIRLSSAPVFTQTSARSAYPVGG